MKNILFQTKMNITKLLNIFVTIIIILFFINGLIISVGFSQEKTKKTEKKEPRIAVFPLTDTNKQAREEGYGEAIAGMLTTSIINCKIFRVMERSEIEQILKEQTFQISGAVNAETAKKIGELYAVDFLLFGTVAKFGNIIESDIRVVDTETGEAILAEAANAQSALEMRTMVNEMVNKIEIRYRQKYLQPVIVGQPKKIDVSRPTPPPVPVGEMVLIPGGEFLMGNNNYDAPWNEKPAHKVYVDAFYMDIKEVTNAQYKTFIDATGHRVPPLWNDSRFNQPDMPVVGITWQDANQYATWAGKRLPTEAEWEFAARGGLQNATFPWGNEDATGKAWFGQSYEYGSCSRVGAFNPNGYGLYDMAGNVSEWCSDWYLDNTYQNATYSNPTGPLGSTYVKVIRGGSWYEDSFFLRCAARNSLAPDSYSTATGFRCVRSAK